MTRARVWRSSVIRLVASAFIIAGILFGALLIRTAVTTQQLRRAVVDGSFLGVRNALASGADPNARVGLGRIRRPILVEAIQRDEAEIALNLIRAGADVRFDVPSDTGPLVEAAKANLPEVVRALIDSGADVNDGGPLVRITPLMVAARHADPEVVSLLLDAGARTDLRSFHGVDAAYFARSRKDGMSEGILQCLEVASKSVSRAVGSSVPRHDR